MSKVVNKLKKECIRNVLLDINPLVRQYHKNVIRSHTGLDPGKANGLGLEDSVCFLRRVWGSCLDWGNQRIDFIGRSVEQLGDFLAGFSSREDIHNFHVFSEKLEKYPSKKHIALKSHDEVVRLTEFLQKFHSVRIKTAALVMRFLCLDCNFFNVDKSQLVPPLDRVNYRMCEQLFGTEYVLEKLGEYTVSFDTGAHFGFAEIGKQILGKKQVLIDNLWFIGHFYHDGKDRNDCRIREGARIVDYPHLKDITRKLPDLCPFKMHGCSRK